MTQICPHCGSDNFGPLAATTVYGCLSCGKSYGPYRPDRRVPLIKPVPKPKEGTEK